MTEAEPFPFDPRARSGKRLARLIGKPAHDVTEVVNLFDHPVDRWSAPVARVAAAAVLARSTADRIVLCGRRVAAAFGADDTVLFVWRERDGRQLAVIPHPSGRNRLWNNPRVSEAAAEFLGALA